MNVRIKKIWAFFRNQLLAKKVWHWPRKSDVLIFDASGNEYLLEYLSPWNPEVLHIRGEQLNMLVFIASFLRRGKRIHTYIDCFIERVRPRLIVTFIDNSNKFLALSLRHPEAKTLFIQNGWRGYYADIFEMLDKSTLGFRNKLHVDYMLTFGSVAGDEYARYVSGDVVPMGSLKSNSLNKSQPAQKGVISFVSQWHEEGFNMDNIFYTHEEFFKQADRSVMNCLVQYSKKNNKRLFIIPRHDRHGKLRTQEEAYYRELLGREPEFLEPQGRYPTYQAMDASEVVVTVDSTLGYESIARGKKTAILSVRSKLLNIQGLTYGWPGTFPDMGPFWTNNCDEENFVRILDYLFAADDAQWKKDVSESGFDSLMIYDPENTIFKSIIEKELGIAPPPIFFQPGTTVPDNSRAL